MAEQAIAGWFRYTRQATRYERVINSVRAGIHGGTGYRDLSTLDAWPRLQIQGAAYIELDGNGAERP